MDESERKDVEWMIARGMRDLNAAHEARVKNEAEAAEAAREVRRIKVEQGRREHDARLLAILAKHPTRWAISIDGRLVVPDKKKGVRVECPSCKTQLSEVMEKLCWVMEQTYEKFWAENFHSGNGRLNMINSDTTCACGQRVTYRVISVPY